MTNQQGKERQQEQLEIDFSSTASPDATGESVSVSGAYEEQQSPSAWVKRRALTQNLFYSTSLYCLTAKGTALVLSRYARWCERGRNTPPTRFFLNADHMAI